MFQDYTRLKRQREKAYGRMYVASACIPFFYSLFKVKSMMTRLGFAYLLFSTLDAFYDMGVYTYFFMHAPKHMRTLLELPPEKNFAAIQVALFMRFCASLEIKKATGEQSKKQLQDLVFVRSIKNQLRDQGVRVRNYAVLYGLWKPRGPRD